jgi:hypothetical protein
MVTSNLMGGLGNYMFQISVAYSLSLDNKDKLIFNINDSLRVHEPIKSYTNNIFSKINFVEFNLDGLTNYYEPFFHYQKIPLLNNVKLNGYFQSEKYFLHNRNQILELFEIDEKSKKEIYEKYSEILDGETCSIHVRRGDYLSLNGHHPVCDLEYYNKSINLFDKNTKFLVFSDDIKWCQENFKGENFTFISGNRDFIDIWLMSLCQNNIIANSTFSWWGAWLNQNINKKVIAPSKWFGPLKINHNTQDLIPKTWKII